MQYNLQHFSVGTGPCLALRGIPAPFDNGQKNLGTEKPSCWTFGRGILSCSRLIQDSWVFFLGESSGLQAVCGLVLSETVVSVSNVLLILSPVNRDFFRFSESSDDTMNFR